MGDNVLVCLGGKEFGWLTSEYEVGIKVHFKGYLNGYSSQLDSAACAGRAAMAALQGCYLQLANLDGHFAVIAEFDGGVISAVDRIRSIPLLWSNSRKHGFIVGDHAKPLLDTLQLGPDAINIDAASDILLAGYALGSDSLYSPIHALLPGQVAIYRGCGSSPHVERYALYRPWLVQNAVRDECIWRRELHDVTLNILQKMVDRAQGRQFLLPLSAGLDSRLIASGLKHLGYKNVQCFSYGRRGNHEAVAAQKIAEALGYPWHFLPSTTKEVRRKRRSNDFQRYMTLADNLVATPLEQDIFTIMDLNDVPWADREAIIVNGQSGDYISGNHIPRCLFENLHSEKERREEIVFAAMVAKHFDLWADLKTGKNLTRVKSRVWRELIEADAPLDDPRFAYALYEFSEFQNRQAKYVLGNQRSYEVFGWEWHLPLWDKDYLEWWQQVPVSLKFGQRLYREMLVEANWGGVWSDLLPAPRWITPKWIRPIRWMAKLSCGLFGKEAWHNVERRFFNHVMDHVRNYAAVPYWKVAFGPAHRNHVSWLTLDYLTRHRIDISDLKRLSQ